MFIRISLSPMNLVLDFGNTRIKAGLFDGQTLIENKVFDSENELLHYTDTLVVVKKCLIGSVTNAHLKTSEVLPTKFKTIVFTANTSIPLKNYYKSALTLGSDRIAASVGAFSLYPSHNVLTIDAGTCIKYNFVNSNNEYLGGAISPGIPMRLKSMHHYTSALPLVEMDKSYEKLIGQSTTESLLSGALLGAVAEVEATIQRYESQYNDLVVIVTGGDADYLCKQVKKRFFADPNILLRGLNTILNFNIEK